MKDRIVAFEYRATVECELVCVHAQEMHQILHFGDNEKCTFSSNHIRRFLLANCRQQRSPASIEREQMAKVALVTGGSKGIGFAIAQQLRRDGWQVAITSRELARAEEAADKIASSGVLPLAYHAPRRTVADGAGTSDATQLVAQVTKELGKISALVNAAGVSKDSLLLRLQDRELDELLLTNLVGPIQMAKAVAKDMMQQRRGSIINIGSVVGAAGNVGQTAYSASKSGLVGVTKSLAKEFGNRNIRVNLVEPGFVQTDMTAAMTDAARERILPNIPLARLGTPEEVAKVVAFLASDDASYITGQCIRVDGGLVI